jgi:hypothetical protein
LHTYPSLYFLLTSLLVNIFSGLPVGLTRLELLALADQLFRGVVIFELVRDFINGHVSLELFPEDVFYSIEYFTDVLAFIQVVIFLFDMHHKFRISFLATASQGFDITESHPPLDLVLGQVVQVLVREEECPVLLKHPSIHFYYWARKDDPLAVGNIE